jgi:hypothetical protein
MQEPENLPVESPEDFGMTQEDVKHNQLKGLGGRLKYYLAAIGPTFVRIFNTIFYWTLKIIKSFFKTVYQMVFKGGADY